VSEAKRRCYSGNEAVERSIWLIETGAAVLRVSPTARERRVRTMRRNPAIRGDSYPVVNKPERSTRNRARVSGINECSMLSRPPARGQANVRQRWCVAGACRGGTGNHPEDENGRPCYNNIGVMRRRCYHVRCNCRQSGGHRRVRQARHPQFTARTDLPRGGITVRKVAIGGGCLPKAPDHATFKNQAAVESSSQETSIVNMNRYRA